MSRRRPSPVGAHVFVAGGLARRGLGYAREIGAEALQVFVSNPRGWAQSAGDPAQDEEFVDGCRRNGLPVYVHAPYLVNVASPTPATVERSVAALRHSVRRGRAICARGVVVHAGSIVGGSGRAQALEQVRTWLRPLVEELDDGDPDLLVELTAGGRGSLVSAARDIPDYLDALAGHPKVGVCVDTCHAHAAGSDLAVPGAVTALLSAVARQAGPGRLRLVHANDSKDPAGSARDRHENVGRGTIGSAAFGELFSHPATRGVPVLVETPGTPEVHAADLALLRSLRDGTRS